MKHLSFILLSALLLGLMPGLFSISTSAASTIWSGATGNITIDGDEITINPNTKTTAWVGDVSLKEIVASGQNVAFSYDVKFTDNNYTVFKIYNSSASSWMFGRVQYYGGSIRLTLQMLFNGTWYSYDEQATPCSSKNYTIKLILDYDRDTFSILGVSSDGILVHFKEHSLGEFPDADFFEKGTLSFRIGAESFGAVGTSVITNPSLETEFPSGSIKGKNIINKGKEYTYSFDGGENASSYSWKLVSSAGVEQTSTEKKFTFTAGNKENYTVALTIGNNDGTITYYKSVRGITREAKATDIAPQSFENVVFINTQGKDYDWHDLVADEIDEYQVEKANYSVCDVKSITKADLLIVDVGATLYMGGVSAEDFATYYKAYIASVREQNPSAVLVLLNVTCPVAYNEVMTLEKLVDYNYTIELTARENNALYADVYSATAFASWNRNDGSMIAQKVYGTIAKYCSCLANSSVFPIQNPYEAKAIQQINNSKFATALTPIKTAISSSNAENIRSSLDNDNLYYDNSTYHFMDNAQRVKLFAKMIADGKNTTLTTHEEFVKFFNKCCYEVVRDNQNTDMLNGTTLKTFVTVGQSVDAGATVSAPSYYAWPPILNRLFTQVLTQELTLINKAVSGTKLTIDDTNYVCGKKRIDMDITPNNPDILYIDYGFNDISNNVTVDSFISQFKTYLETIHQKNPNTILVVMDVNYALKDSRRQVSDEFNYAYCKLVADYDYIIYADNYFEVSNAQWLLYDGVHPTDVGQSVYASYLYVNALQHMNFGKTYSALYEAETLADGQPKSQEEPTDKGGETKSGCGSALGLSVLPLAFVPFALLKKKKEK